MIDKSLIVDARIKNTRREAYKGKCPSCGKDIKERENRCLCGQKIINKI